MINNYPLNSNFVYRLLTFKKAERSNYPAIRNVNKLNSYLW